MIWQGPILIGIACLLWAAGILLLGAGRFGRAGSQGLIDRIQVRFPWMARWLNLWHSEIRASFHYIEFMSLTLLLYLFFSRLAGEFRPGAALAAWLLASAFAYVDEWRQSLTPGRQFRRVDFLHSLFGAELTALLIWLFYLLKRLLA